MEEEVAVTSLAIRAPGMAAITDLVASARGERRVVPPRVSTFPGHVTIQIQDYTLDVDSPFYPSRKARKTMSPDSVAALVCAGELLESGRLLDADLSEVPFFVAAGPSLDAADADVAVEALEHLLHDDITGAEHFKLLYEGTHPLFALRVLSNAGSCFVAQRYGLTGDSTTFGTTSTDGFHALEASVDYIRTGRARMAVVGAYSGSGPLTALSHWTLRRASELWRESGACVFLLFEAMSGARERGQVPMAIIDRAHAGAMVPNLLSATGREPYAFMADEERADSVIFSGGFCEADYENERRATEVLWDDASSWFTELGTMGTASTLMNLATAVARIGAGKIGEVDCVDRDLYGRETWIRVRKP